MEANPFDTIRNVSQSPSKDPERGFGDLSSLPGEEGALRSSAVAPTSLCGALVLKPGGGREIRES
jgi:hypothetical protein